MTRSILVFASFASAALFATALAAKDLVVEMHNVNGEGVGAKIGTIIVTETPKGLSFKVDVAGIPPGEHGFHLHEKGDCGPGVKESKKQAALAAGGHYDPASRHSHGGPQGNGHKGDLPFLTATDKGVNVEVQAPRLTITDVEGRALVIHEGGDNYTNPPENGGGMGRIACGVVPKS
jgi:Cu-Zn family superoxide dismutase